MNVQSLTIIIIITIFVKGHPIYPLYVQTTYRTYEVSYVKAVKVFI